MQLKKSNFQEYEFTQKELEEILQFNHLQVAYLQTLLSQTLLRKLAAKFDPKEVYEYAQFEAEMQGRMSILLELLQQTDESQKVVASQQSKSKES